MDATRHTVTYAESDEDLFPDDLPHANALRAAYRLGVANGAVNAYKNVIACLTDPDSRRTLQDRLQMHAAESVVPDGGLDDGTHTRK